MSAWHRRTALGRNFSPAHSALTEFVQGRRRAVTHLGLRGASWGIGMLLAAVLLGPSAQAAAQGTPPPPSAADTPDTGPMSPNLRALPALSLPVVSTSAAAPPTLIGFVYRDAREGHRERGGSYFGLVLRNDTDETLHHMRVRIVSSFANGVRLQTEEVEVLPPTVPPGGFGATVALPHFAWDLNLQKSQLIGLEVLIQLDANSALQDLDVVTYASDGGRGTRVTLRNVGPLSGPPQDAADTLGQAYSWGDAYLACFDSSGRLDTVLSPGAANFPIPLLAPGDTHDVMFDEPAGPCSSHALGAGLYPSPWLR